VLAHHHHRGISYTANRGSPACGDNTQQTDPGGFVAMPRTTSSGATFNIRIYGKLCRDNRHRCAQFRPGGAIGDIGGSFVNCAHANIWGYTATFAPAANCGPPEWPTNQLRDAYNGGDMRYLPYVRWCDFAVKVN